MRAIAFAILFIVYSCTAMAQVPYAAEDDAYYSRIVGGISIDRHSGGVPFLRKGYTNSAHVSILVKLEAVDRSILLDKKATRRLLNQISLWVDEQLVMQGVMRPSLTEIHVADKGRNILLIAHRDGLSEPWWIRRFGKLSLEHAAR
ncbi:hypothetical protein [Bradyrhizobium sp. CCBAU 53421]|uniref:hypothetical protein n=1 Tax=Bradyrhizobium sp. CCBAU 53421 TaxID=1325120 RepID=UPI00188D4581|nr:hypothetical protein [Bradyrhizobium sp. CCBAU 53421]QOZ33257.1 hypothetical protein XH92_17560 [Bradyrhizobium sp. CCBAU 53421]